MVRGLALFREHFKDHNDKYVLIGGTACDILMENLGMHFRATKDLDIVLIVEALDSGFANIFWDFIKNGKYKNIQKSTGKKLFYRFYDPEEKSYPYMLELFSRVPDFLKNTSMTKITPIPFEDKTSSLSAILLDNEFYTFLKNGITNIDDLSVLLPEYIIPLKIKAYLDLSKNKADGMKIDNKDIKKHRNDVFRLYSALSLETRVTLPKSISDDFKIFLEKIKSEDLNLKQLNLRSSSLHEVINNFKSIYMLL